MLWRNRWILWGATLYLIGALAYIAHEYHQTRQELLANIDQRLHAGAVGLAHLLGDRLHNQVLSKNTLNTEQDRANTLSLSQYNNDIGTHYVYTMVLIDDAIYFTSSSAQADEIQADEVYNYLLPYSEASPDDFAAFRKTGPSYFESKDRWGHFRSILMPRTTANGHLYIVGADVTMDEVNTLIANAIMKAMAVGLFFLILGVPILFLYTQPLRQQLYEDNLTGLPNRSRLKRDVLEHPDPLLVLINIDDFKEINDFFGGAMGDAVLQALGKRIQNLMPTDTQLYKLSGDEYAILGRDSLKSLLVEDLVAGINREHMVVHGHSLSLSVSAGVATGMGTQLLEHADMALKSARRRHKPFVIYSEALKTREEYEQNLLWSHKLKQALAEGRVVPWYQPIVSNANPNDVRYECLARLIDEDGSVVSPAVFLEISKRTRQHGQLTRAIVSQACARFEHPDRSFSINLSVLDIIEEDTRAYLLNALAAFPQPGRITLEILESEGIENYDEVSLFISEVKKLGVRIAVDDFGSGYSNFEHLLKLAVDYIKIDGSLIHQLPSSKESSMVVGSIVEFAHKLGARTVAEFVSSEDIALCTKRLGVDFDQGYHHGEPRPEPY